MPSKQETELAAEKQEFYPSDVEELVAAINRKLQLKSRPCLGAMCTKQKRVSPYSIPLRTIPRKVDKENSTDCESCKYCCRLKTKSPVLDTATDDPYEMLQDLLREGALIKEAVKRIQLGLHQTKPKETNYYEIDDLDVVKSPTYFEL